ncbi:complex I subunit 5 family protein [Spirochaeta africana]|uniref:Formate hydrogenlyase subunit 3/multisubunit Na+/H+ antiporter, MnhD subunit n=1 Tax=Spirochaeta africana (strain ATCC 700263 / DSM 8902 / Z-7692) TaxID=889378 RepID=H9ULG6_SPIAZ|nr:proton-conducting transporter membrane subunit [Spirochaeta africana]AFG38359.1 formate hydrogenlyase subunit 3/multisubunit Na+/H+ antiporter, MnhD subunit [Spirochaeta africana DSM 8902]
MTALTAHLPILIIILPLLNGFLMSLTDKLRPKISLPLALGGALLHGMLIFQLAREVFTAGTRLYYLGAHAPPLGIVLVADAAAVVFLLILGAGHVLATLYRWGTDGADFGRGKAGVLTSIFFCSLAGLTLAGDLFNLFVFIELSTVASIGLIVLKRRNAGTVAGFVYIMAASISGVLLLVGILLLYIATGHLSLAGIATEIHTLPAGMHAAITACITVSFGIKAGLVPLHFWQPRAYHAAGSTAAGVLSGFGMKVYLYTLLRLLFVPLQAPLLQPAIFPLLLGMALINILVGHLMALIDRDLKRLLAFSSVAHAGYILAGAAAAGMLLSRSARQYSAAAEAAAMTAGAAALLHCINHAATKSGLLWSGRKLIANARSSRITELSGAAQHAPLHLAGFILAAAGIIGMPPTLGFASKWHIASTQLSVFPILVISLGTVISLYYYGRIVSVALTQHSQPEIPGSGDAAPPEKPRLRLDAAIVISVGIAVLLSGPIEHHLIPLLSQAAESLFDARLYIDSVLPGGL